MLAKLSFTEARNHLTEVVDNAQKYQPTLIKSRKKSEDASILMRLDFLRSLLNDAPHTAAFKVDYFTEKDASVTCSVQPFDIVVNGASRQEAADLAAAELLEYAQEYMDEANYRLYANSPNRGPHLALVLKVLLCNTPDEVKELCGLA
jgi:hypothetical protein